MPELTPDTLRAIEARHVAYLEERLVSDEAERAWGAQVTAVSRELLAARVGALADPLAIADALDAALTSDGVAKVARPFVKAALPFLLVELRSQTGKLEDRVPAAARARIEEMVARPGVLPERLLREIAHDDAIEEIMRDVLYDGFKEFSEKVNPFTAEWGIPSVLKRMSVFGGAMAKGIEAVKLEFDRRLEPELRRFLAVFSRQGLDRMVDATVARADQPASIAFRRRLVAWVLEQEIARLARDADEEAILVAHELALDVVAAELDRPEGKARRRAALAALIEASKDRTVAELLGGLGVEIVFDDAAIARATWPVARAVLGGPSVRAWTRGLVAGFYEAERARLDAK